MFNYAEVGLEIIHTLTLVSGYEVVVDVLFRLIKPFRKVVPVLNGEIFDIYHFTGVLVCKWAKTMCNC